MGFLGKMMAAVGIGAARVDTRLGRPEARVGERLAGVVAVQGGRVEQRIERVNLGLATRYRSDDSTVTHTLFSQPVVPGFTIRPGETREFPFELPVPHGTPLSLPGSEVWLVTDADIEGAVDPGDTDGVWIRPSEDMETVIQAAQDLGFRLRHSETEYRFGGVVQELSFRPPAGPYRLTELELAFFPAPGGLDLLLEVDRRTTGVASLFTSEVEHRGRWFVPAALLRQGSEAVARELQGRVQALG